MEQNQRQINQTAKLAGIVGQVGCVTLVLIAIALGVGLLLDNLLGTKPLFTILLLVGSVPVTMYLTVRLSLSAAARANLMLASKDKNTEEETKE